MEHGSQAKPPHFTLKERGKVRPIDAPHIEDRQVYKVLTKKVLVPLYVPSMIYDNKASQKAGGLHFHYKRLPAPAGPLPQAWPGGCPGS